MIFKLTFIQLTYSMRFDNSITENNSNLTIHKVKCGECIPEEEYNVGKHHKIKQNILASFTNAPFKYITAIK